VKLNWRHAGKVLEWCQNYYGPSKHCKYIPTLSYRKADYVTEDVSAYYDDQIAHIYINKEACNTIEELTKTVIHEYQHYLQNPKHYEILAMYLSRERNPMEIEAEKIARRDYKKCIKEVFSIPF
jgi:hypothetical protein